MQSPFISGHAKVQNDLDYHFDIRSYFFITGRHADLAFDRLRFIISGDGRNINTSYAFKASISSPSYPLCRLKSCDKHRADGIEYG